MTVYLDEVFLVNAAVNGLLLETSVRLTGGAKKGRIALEFYSPDDREALMDALLKMEKPWKAKTEE